MNSYLSQIKQLEKGQKSSEEIIRDFKSKCDLVDKIKKDFRSEDEETNRSKSKSVSLWSSKSTENLNQKSNDALFNSYLKVSLTN